MLWLASYLFPSYQLEVRGASHVKFHWLAKLSVLGLVLQKMVDLWWTCLATVVDLSRPLPVVVCVGYSSEWWILLDPCICIVPYVWAYESLARYAQVLYSVPAGLTERWWCEVLSVFLALLPHKYVLCLLSITWFLLVSCWKLASTAPHVGL